MGAMWVVSSVCVPRLPSLRFIPLVHVLRGCMSIHSSPFLGYSGADPSGQAPSFLFRVFLAFICGRIVLFVWFSALSAGIHGFVTA